jgi:hypothetical protein
MASSCLLSLPYELRQQILRFCLLESGTIELQRPLWVGHETFTQPLFRTSKQLREEALEAFYKANTFVWVVDVGKKPDRTDPATYPLAHAGGSSRTAMSALPWYYPKLLQHLRHLRLNVYLPPSDSEDAWFYPLKEALARLVIATDQGRRLNTLQVLFISRFYRVNTLSTTQLDVLGTLAEMKVPGRVELVTRYDLEGVKASIDSLQLEKKMRASSNPQKSR